MKSRCLKTLVLVLIGLALWGYAVLRAAMLSLTHDEAVSYLLFVYPGAGHLLDCYTANNHFLNTILMFVSSRVFGNGEWALRIPNVIAHGLYLLVTGVLVRNRFGWFAAAGCFLLLNLNPFVLDFFSLARGYGLALGLMTAGVYFLLEYVRDDRHDHTTFLKAWWCVAGAVLANLTLMHVAVALVGLDLLLHAAPMARDRQPVDSILRELCRRFATYWKHVLLLLLFVAPVSLNLAREGELYFGGTAGFWQDTVSSLISGFLYGRDYPSLLHDGIFLGIVVILALLLVTVVMGVWRGRKGPVPDVSVVGGLGLLAVLSMVVQHVLFGVRYPIERAALFLVPLFSLAFVFLVERGCASRVRILARIACWLATAGMIAHLVMVSNLSHTYTWAYDSDTRQSLVDLDADLRMQRETVGPVRLGISWEFEPSVNYYLVCGLATFVEPVTREGPAGSYDYYYIMPRDRGRVSGHAGRLVREYPRSGNRLFAADPGHSIQGTGVSDE